MRLGGGGDCCHGCKRPLASLDQTFIGADRQDRPMVVGQCCSSQLARLYGIGVYVAYRENPDTAERALRITGLNAAKAAGNG
jgi:hypothetical protein